MMNFEKWKKLITSDEPSDRSYAADNTPYDGNQEEVASYLINCLGDPVGLVRTCAADSLREFDSDVVREELRAAIEIEKDNLARAYLFSSLGAVGSFGDLAVLGEAFDRESDPQVKIRAAEGLASCASSIAIAEFIKGIETGEPAIETSANIYSDYLEIYRWNATKTIKVIKELLNNDSLSISERECLEDLYNKLRRIVA
jgi:HEAT repeat protein